MRAHLIWPWNCWAFKTAPAEWKAGGDRAWFSSAQAECFSGLHHFSQINFQLQLEVTWSNTLTQISISDCFSVEDKANLIPTTRSNCDLCEISIEIYVDTCKNCLQLCFQLHSFFCFIFFDLFLHVEIPFVISCQFTLDRNNQKIECDFIYYFFSHWEVNQDLAWRLQLLSSTF